MRSLRRRCEAQTQTFLPALYGAARRLMSEPAEAEAVVMEVYGRAYRSFQEPTDRGLLKRWLFELWWQVCLGTWRQPSSISMACRKPALRLLPDRRL